MDGSDCNALILNVPIEVVIEVVLEKPLQNQEQNRASLLEATPPPESTIVESEDPPISIEKCKITSQIQMRYVLK